MITGQRKKHGKVIGPLSTRFPEAAGLGGVALPGAPLLAACGKSSGSAAQTIGKASASPVSTADLKKILDYVGPFDPKHSGAGVTWKLGAVPPYNGNGSFFGKLWQTGITLAQQHIEAIGGPWIQFVA